MKRKAKGLELSFGLLGTQTKEIYSKKLTKKQKRKNGRNEPRGIRRNKA